MSSKSAPAPAPTMVLCAQRNTEEGILSRLCHNNLRPGCSQMLIYCRKDEYVVVSPHSGIPHTVQMHHLPWCETLWTNLKSNAQRSQTQKEAQGMIPFTWIARAGWAREGSAFPPYLVPLEVGRALLLGEGRVAGRGPQGILGGWENSISLYGC